MTRTKIIWGLGVVVSLMGGSSLSYAQLADSTWPIFRGDSTHSGLSKTIFPDTTYYLRPPVGILGTELFTPIFTEDSISVLVSPDGHISTYNPVNSSTHSKKIDGSVSAPGALGANQTLYLSTSGAGKPKFHAIRVSKFGIEPLNEVELQESAGQQINRSPNISGDGTIFFVDTNKKIYAVNVDPDGRLLPESLSYTTLVAKAKSPPMIKRSRVFVIQDTPNNGSKIAVFEYKNGEWSRSGIANFSTTFRWLLGHPSPNQSALWAGADSAPFIVKCGDNCAPEAPIDFNGPQQLPIFMKKGDLISGSPIIISKGTLRFLDVNENEVLYEDASMTIVNDPVVDGNGTIFFVAERDEMRGIYALRAGQRNVSKIAEGRTLFDNANGGAFGPEGMFYLPGNGKLFVVEPPIPKALAGPNLVTGCTKEPLASIVAVLVNDQNGKPFHRGHPVTFGVLKGSGFLDGGVTDTTIISDPDGFARVQWILGPDTTQQLLGASSAGLSPVQVKAKPSWPRLISDNKVDFGSTSAVEPITLPYTITNDDSCILKIDSAEVLDDPSTSFNVDPSALPLTLRRGESGKLHLTFYPSDIGQLSGTLALQSNDPSLDRNTIELRGNGTCPIETKPPLADFGRVEVGRDSIMDMTLTNRTSRDLRFRPELGSAVFTHLPIADSIRSGESIELRVRFTPGSTRIHRDTLSIIVADTIQNVCGTALRGEGVNSQGPTIFHTQLRVVKLDKDTAMTVIARDPSGVANIKLHYRIAGTGEYDQSGVAGGYRAKSFVDSSAALPASLLTPTGLEYYIEATDTDSNTTRRPLPDTLFYSTQVELPAGTLSDSLPAKRFKMISLPIQIEKMAVDSAFHDIFGQMNQDKAWMWRIAPENTQRDSPYVAIDKNDRQTTIVDGDAFLAYANELVTQSSPAGKSFPTDRPFQIPLQPGWNAFSLPFKFDIPLANVFPSTYCSNICLLKDNSSWQYALDVSDFKFRPWQGYVALNDADQVDTLFVIPSSHPVAPGCDVNPASIADWLIRIDAIGESSADQCNTVGIISDANAEWDEYELREPPRLRNSVSLYFDHSDWPSKDGIYTTDFQPNEGRNYVWAFKVLGRTKGEAVRLEFRNMEYLPGRLDIKLLDRDLKYVHDPVTEPEYLFRSEGADSPRSFELYVGDQEFVSSKTVRFSGVPETVELLGNFPNPFNPTTSIKFGLPKQALVSILIYNMKGGLVRRLMTERRMNSGHHVIVWDGKNEDAQPVSSGVYITRLLVGRAKIDHKIAVLK